MRRTCSRPFVSQLAFTLLVCAFLIVPVFMSIVAGLTENFFVGVRSGLTLRWIVEVWELYRDTIFRSILIALACLAVTLVLGVPAAYVLAKRQNRWTRLIEEFLVLPVAIPGLAIALALIITYGGFRDFRTSWGFILVGHVLYTLPFMVRSVLAVLSSFNFQDLEESAASLGAGFWRRFFAHRCRTRAGHRRRRAHRGDAVDRRVQPHLDAAYAGNHDAARRARRQLRLDAPGDRQRLYAGLLRHDHPAARRAAVGRQTPQKDLRHGHHGSSPPRSARRAAVSAAGRNGPRPSERVRHRAAPGRTAPRPSPTARARSNPST